MATTRRFFETLFSLCHLCIIFPFVPQLKNEKKVVAYGQGHP